jgi:hypothetical protein
MPAKDPEARKAQQKAWYKANKERRAALWPLFTLRDQRRNS